MHSDLHFVALERVLCMVVQGKQEKEAMVGDWLGSNYGLAGSGTGYGLI